MLFTRKQNWKVQKSIWDTTLFIRVWNTLESTIEQAVTKLLIDPLQWTVMGMPLGSHYRSFVCSICAFRHCLFRDGSLACTAWFPAKVFKPKVRVYFDWRLGRVGELLVVGRCICLVVGNCKLFNKGLFWWIYSIQWCLTKEYLCAKRIMDKIR